MIRSVLGSYGVNHLKFDKGISSRTSTVNVINVIMLLIKLTISNQLLCLLSKYRCMRNNFIIGTIIKYRLNYFAYIII